MSGQLSAVTRLLYGSTLAVTIVCIPLLGFISAMVAHERRREVAIIRALGATKRYVIRLMLAEAISIAIIGSVVGILLAMVVLVGFEDFISLTLKIPFILPSPLAMAWMPQVPLSFPLGSVALHRFIRQSSLSDQSPMKPSGGENHNRSNRCNKILQMR